MATTGLRPRYKFTTTLSANEIRQRIKAALKSENQNTYELQQRSVSNHIIVVLPKKHKHFWSPTLDVNLETKAADKTLVRVLIGPEPSIWTMFMFIYTIGGLMAAAGFVLGSSQYILGHGSWYFMLIPAGVVLVAIFYMAGLAGKTKAQEQMHILKNFMEEAIGQPVFHEEVNKQAGLS